jgi:multimeric flavodoxin WrbA/NAD(P)H-dependent FMN reductase
MKVIVLNGSPKGKTSVTMQYVAWLEKEHPEHSFTIFHVAAQIRKLEREDEAFAQLTAAVAEGDLILWAFPLYIMGVHGDYQRFIELIWEKDAVACFVGKHAAQLATSIHFFDHTAVNLVKEVCQDLGMRHVAAFSVGMHDLFDPVKRQELARFFRLVSQAVTEDLLPAPNPSLAMSVPDSDAFRYQPGPVAKTYPLEGRKLAIVVDDYHPQSNLGQMVDAFSRRFDVAPEIINLATLNIKGGCLGCIHCGLDNECIYEGKDDVIPLYEKLRYYDAVINAATIGRRYFSGRWKRFVDRRFYRTHQPILEKAFTAWLVSGPLAANANLRQIMEANAQLDGQGLVGIVTDEGGNDEAIDKNLDFLAASLVLHLQQPLPISKDFLGIGGQKIFRDEIWGNLRPVFQGDHHYYKKHGYYDFPHKDYRIRFRNVGAGRFLRIPPVKKWFQRNMKENMIRGYQKLLK